MPRAGIVWLFEDLSFGREGRAREASRNGFPRRCRLTKADEFTSVFGFRKSIKSEHFLLHYCPRKGGKTHGARLGLVVAKRCLRRSVDRNLIKRLVREIFRIRRSELPPCDLVVRLAVSPGSPVDRRTVAAEIRNLLEKLALDLGQ
ncbi:MAG: ribonuclease P protein component [Candidatus Accumulibacter sp.]|nr:ribonuclease P protein component [Accumulibacter sp.]